MLRALALTFTPRQGWHPEDPVQLPSAMVGPAETLRLPNAAVMSAATEVPPPSGSDTTWPPPRVTASGLDETRRDIIGTTAPLPPTDVDEPVEPPSQLEIRGRRYWLVRVAVAFFPIVIVASSSPFLAFALLFSVGVRIRVDVLVLIRAALIFVVM